MRVRKHKNGKAAGIIKSGGNRVVDCTRVKKKGQNTAIIEVLAC